MGWRKFSNYKKRYWEIQHQGTTVYLTFRKQKNVRGLKANSIEVAWRCKKFKNGIHKLYSTYPPGKKANWKDIFERLRMSLTYGLNPAARKVIDRMREAEGKPKIHYRGW